MTTTNSLGNVSQTLALGTGTANDTNNLLWARKDQATATELRCENQTTTGEAIIYSVSDSGGAAGQRSIGFSQYGSAFSDAFGSAGQAVLFSNAYSNGMNIVCENGNMTMQIGTSPVTQITLASTGGQYRGNNTNVAPPAGYIGELISASATTGSLTSNVAANVTSILLTAGLWDVEAYVEFDTTGTVAGNVQWFGAISTSSASLTGTGENGTAQTGGCLPVNAVNGVSVHVGATRCTLSGSTTIYLNCRGASTSTFTNVTCTGVIRAVRVG